MAFSIESVFCMAFILHLRNHIFVQKKKKNVTNLKYDKSFLIDKDNTTKSEKVASCATVLRLHRFVQVQVAAVTVEYVSSQFSHLIRNPYGYRPECSLNLS
jgi:hypothetical protein